MIRIHLTHPDGTHCTIEANPGRSLMRAALAAGIDGIAADCGGCLTCATCHVVVADSWLPRLTAPSRDELAMLDMTAVPRQTGSRLSCQIPLDASLDGLRVTLPQTQY